jgi:hypothetical protein
MSTILPQSTPVRKPKEGARPINAGEPLLETARAYARMGWHVFPVHVPIHDEAGKLIGCTCEDWRRQQDPGYECPQPGKCPAVKWRDKSTVDETQILNWWGRAWSAGNVRYFPNIGIDTGRSGLLVLDMDEYKEHYAGDDLLSIDDQDTVTALSGGGGEHLIYDRAGATYGNSTKGLPSGIDIRGDGGYIVAAPSLHKSGRRYDWELGYSPEDMAPRAIPEALRTILDGAQRATPQIAVTFSDTATPAPDLTQFNLHQSTIESIHNPPAKGYRSEHDYRVVAALCRAGATDDQIRAIFTHYPVGRAGKYAQGGDRYLATTIQNARADLAAKALEAVTVRQIIEAARAWVRHTDFSEVVPAELQAANGYRTNETDKAIALGALAILESYGRLEGPISAAQLSEATGRSLDTCRKSMRRLMRLFLVVNTDKREANHALVYRLNDELQQQLRRSYTVSNSSNCVPCTIYATLPLDTHRAHDAFVRSTRPLDPADLAERIAERAAEGREAKATGDERRRVRATKPSAGPAALIVADAITEFGPMRPGEIATVTAKGKYSVSRAVGRLIDLGLADKDGDGRVYLVDGWKDALNEITPQMPTAGIVRRRILARADSTIKQCQEGLKDPEATPEHRNMLNQRLQRAANTKARIARAEGFDIAKTAHQPSAGIDFWDLRKIQHLRDMHAKARLDAAELKRSPEWELNKLARQMRSEGLGKPEAARMLQYAGYTVDEAWGAIRRAYHVASIGR